MNAFRFKVTDAVVVMDREQGAVEMLASKGIRLHPIFSLFNLLDVLLASERIDQEMAQKVRTFILANNTFRYSDQSGSERQGGGSAAPPPPAEMHFDL